MPRRRRHAAAAALRRGAAPLLFCALLLGCGGAGSGAAGGGGGGGGAGAGLSAGPGRDRYQGRYEGHRLPPDAAATAPGNTCRTRPRPVRFEVENGIIEMRTDRGRAANRRKAELWGAVSADGQVAMRPASGKRTVVGRIEGDRLTAADTQESQALAQAVAQGGKAPCLYRYEATRVGGAGARSAAPRRDGEAAAAPPVERFPQP